MGVGVAEAFGVGVGGVIFPADTPDPSVAAEPSPGDGVVFAVLLREGMLQAWSRRVRHTRTAGSALEDCRSRVGEGFCCFMRLIVSLPPLIRRQGIGLLPERVSARPSPGGKARTTPG